MRSRHDITERIEGGAPNYDRIVRHTGFDPLAELQADALMLTKQHERLAKQLGAMAMTTGGYRRLERRVERVLRMKTRALELLVKFGEAKPPARVALVEPLDVQVSFPWLEPH
jgi:hypothetical protein